MNHLDLAWPALVLVISIAGAVLVRLYASHAERVARARTRVWLNEVWRQRRTRDRPQGQVGRTNDDASG